MPTITKAELARRFGVDRSQPTRWAELGMPVLPDGRVDADGATKWVQRHIDGQVRATRRGRGAGGMTAADREQRENLDRLTRLAAGFMAQRTPGLIAALAAELGLSEELARKLHDLSLARAAEMYNQVVDQWLDLEPGEAGPLHEVTPCPEVVWGDLYPSQERPAPA